MKCETKKHEGKAFGWELGLLRIIMSVNIRIYLTLVLFTNELYIWNHNGTYVPRIIFYVRASPSIHRIRAPVSLACWPACL